MDKSTKQCIRNQINEIQYKLTEKKNSENVVKDLIKLELKIKASLASLKAIPRNEAIKKALNKDFEVLNEQSAVNWENYLQNIPAYENALQKITETENNFDADYLHNNLDKLLTNASDIRKLYDDTIEYIKRRSNEPEFENAYTMTKDLVNNLLAAVRGLVELDDRFMATMERNQVDYIEKYKLQDVD